MNEQKHLEYVSNLRFNELAFSEVLGVKALWRTEDLVEINIYLNDDLTELQKEDIDVALGEIMAQFSHGCLDYHYIKIPKNEPLPKSQWWAYRKQ